MKNTRNEIESLINSTKYSKKHSWNWCIGFHEVFWSFLEILTIILEFDFTSFFLNFWIWLHEFFSVLEHFFFILEFDFTSFFTDALYAKVFFIHFQPLLLVYFHTTFAVTFTKKYPEYLQDCVKILGKFIENPTVLPEFHGKKNWPKDFLL